MTVAMTQVGSSVGFSEPAEHGAGRASRSLCLVALATPCSPCSSPQPSPTMGAFAAGSDCGPALKRRPERVAGLLPGCLPPNGCVLLATCPDLMRLAGPVRTGCARSVVAAAAQLTPLPVCQTLGISSAAAGAPCGVSVDGGWFQMEPMLAT